MILIMDRIIFKIWKMFGIDKLIPDEKYLRVMYHIMMKEKLDINHPKTFNQKLQWLKLHDRKSTYPLMVDKYEAKKFVEKLIGEQYIIPTLGVWYSFDEIDFGRLPSRFVLKCTHDSGGIIICKDKESLNSDDARKRIEKCLNNNYYFNGREWPYKTVKPRIIAEKYMEDADSTRDLTDYKIYCFNGEPKLVQVISDRFSGKLMNDHYTLEWEKLDLTRGKYAVSSVPITKPLELDEILSLATKLCIDTYFARIDFYIINHHIYFGEITFFPSSGFVPFNPPKWDKILGEWIHLPIDD